MSVTPLQLALSHAHCLLWSAEVRRDTEGNLIWKLLSFDHQAIRELISLDCPEEEYSQAWFASIPFADRRQMDATSRQAIESGQSGYRHDYRLRDSANTAHWLHEEANITQQDETTWLITGVTTETTQQHRLLDLSGMQNLILKAIATGTPLQETLQHLCDTIMESLSDARTQILRFDPDSQKLFPLISNAIPTTINDVLRAGFPIGPSACSCGTASFRKEPVFVSDITSSPLWEGFAPLVWGQCGLRACWSQPILSASGRVLGTFALYHTEVKDPTAEEQELLQIAAYLAGVALERHEAEQALHRSRAQFQATVAGASDALVLVDAATLDVLEINPVLSKILGMPLTAAQVPGLVQTLGFTAEGMKRLLRRSLRHVQPLRVTTPAGELRELELRTVRTRVENALLLCVTLSDVTARNQTEALTSHVLSGAHCLLWYANIEWRGSDPSRPYMPIQFVHPEAAARFLGLIPELNLALQDIWQQGIAEVDQKKRLLHLQQALSNNQNYSQEFVYVAPQGESRWLREDISLERLSPGHWRVIGVCTDVTSAHHAQQLIYREANYDALTILPNRKFFVEQLQETINSQLRSGETSAVLFLDIDRFKNVNDTLGHLVGDQILALAAQRLRLLAEPHHLVARLGGDEFIILVRTVVALEAVTEFAQELCRILRQPFQIKGYEFFLAASIGIRIFNDKQDHGITTDTILRQADIAMYRSKEAGGDTFEFYNKAMEDQAQERLGLEASLYHAVERGQLVLHYQPQYPCHGGPVVGVEALVRWQHPEGGLLMPINFIELAEETGLILEIGAWVLQTACQQAAHWREAGVPVCVSVNLSARQLQQRTFPEIVRLALHDADLPASFLNLELTETMLVRQTATVQKVLEELQTLGVKMEVDDFGTGFSSLVTLRRFRMHSLKIDRSFVQGMAEEHEDQVIVQGVIDLAHALGMQVIAEGVETTAQRDLLIEMGCDLVQGYLFGYPMPAESLTELLKATAGLAQKRTLLRAA